MDVYLPRVAVMTVDNFLMVALKETKDNILSADGLKMLMQQYSQKGVACMVWNTEKQAWEKLTEEMLGL